MVQVRNNSQVSVSVCLLDESLSVSRNFWGMCRNRRISEFQPVVPQCCILGTCR
jgi:hypothetical protein